VQRDALRVRLPQGADAYAAAADPTSAMVTVSGFDRDVWRSDTIALSNAASWTGTLKVPLVRVQDLTIETHGASGQGHWYSTSDPKDASIVVRPRSPFDGFFFGRALGHANGAMP
jgi:hypothetical protein